MMNFRSKKVLFLLVLFFTSLAFFAWFANQPSKGTVKVKEPKGGEEILGLRSLQLDGNFFSFLYPDTYKLKTHESSESGVLERVVLLGKAGVSKKLVVTIAENSVLEFSEISHVKVRRLKPEVYSEEPLQLGNEPGIVFSKKSNFERVAFVLKNGFLTTIAFSPNSQDLELISEYEEILKSFDWK